MSNSISFTIPENGQGGINAQEAKDGVVVWFDLSQSDAQAGDTITLHWGKKSVTMVLTASDLETPNAVAFTVSPKLIAQRGNGNIQIDAEWTSQDGQSTAAAEPLTVTVDTRAPGAPTIASVGENDRGGINAVEAADGISLAVGLKSSHGKAAVGDTLSIHWGDQTVTYKLTSKDIAGHLATVKLPAEVVTAPGDGQFNVTAQLTDQAGNVSALSAAKMVTLDTFVPTAAVSTLAFSADTGSDQGDFITRTGPQRISGTMNAVLNADEWVQVSVDNGAHWKTATLGADGRSWSVNAVLQPDHQFLLVRVTDGVGNRGPVYSQPYQLDTSPPITLVATVKISDDSGSDDTDFITHVATQTLGGTLVGKVGGGESVQVSLDNGDTWQTATLGASGASWSLPGSVALLEGTHTLLVQVVDAAGNAGESFSQTYVLDTTPPTATVNSLAFSMDTGDSATDLITNTAKQTLSGTVAGRLSAGDVVQVSLDDGATWQNATLQFNSWTLDKITLKGNGTVLARVVDAAGNANEPLSQDYVLDTTPPKATVDSVLLSDDTGIDPADFITNSAEQTLTGTFAGTLGKGETVQVSLDNGQSWQTAEVNGNQWSLDAVLQTGSNAFVQARVADLAGNASPALSEGYVLDLTPPTTEVTSVSFNPNNTTSAQTISGFLSANLKADEWVLVSLDDGVNWKVATVNANQWFLSGVKLLTGGHTLMAEVVDAAGNNSEVLSKPYGTSGVLSDAPITDMGQAHEASADVVVTGQYGTQDGIPSVEIEVIGVHAPAADEFSLS